MTHTLKLNTEYFDDVYYDRKNFEIRKNDRDFKVDDELVLQEWDGKDYTGRETRRKITYIYDGAIGLKKGYVVLGITEIFPFV